MSFWYHFAILFEAVFILTTLDAGTRVGRFILQDLMSRFSSKLGRTDWYPANILASFLMVSLWGYFLYQGVIDPLGGINTLWPLFGMANQMLAVVALIVGNTIIIKTGKQAYAWVTLLPLTWLVIVTTTASYQKIFHPKSSIGFLSASEKYQTAVREGIIIPPATSMEEMSRIVWNNQLDALLAYLFTTLTFIILFDAIRVWVKTIREKSPLSEETV